MTSSFDRQKQQKIMHTMATCHSLRVVDGELLGDPLDIKMFQFTGWSYEEGGDHAPEPTASKFDTITPSVARPPTTRSNEGQQNETDVCCFNSLHVNTLLTLNFTCTDVYRTWGPQKFRICFPAPSCKRSRPTIR